MKRVVNKLDNTKVEVVCDLDEKVWKEAQEKAFLKLAKNLELPGFRKGKVPTEMARKHVDPSKILNEAINAVLQPSQKNGKLYNGYHNRAFISNAVEGRN